MADFEMYSDETCEKAIESFQQKLMDADNLKKDENGNINYEPFWKAMRKEGSMILNITKHLYSLKSNK
jgi:hypothetical protein